MNHPSRETALRVAELVQTWQQLTAASADKSAVDEQIKPYKTQYVRAGAKYGGNYAGMVKWFAERAEETPIP